MNIWSGMATHGSLTSVAVETDRPQDVVLVTRCKDCRHWEKGDCEMFWTEMLPEDYCSCGNRRNTDATY